MTKKTAAEKPKKKKLRWWAKLLIALVCIIVVFLGVSYGTIRYFVGDSLSFKGTLAMAGYGGFALPKWFRNYVLDVDRSYPGLPVLPSNAETYEADRAAMLEKYETYMYGKVPTDGFDIAFTVLSETNVFDDSAIKRDVQITVSNEHGSHSVTMVLYLPVKTETPGVFIGLNFTGNDNLEKEWPIESILASGYAVASMDYQDWEPDNEETFGTGVLKLFPDLKTTAFSAWAFGISRGIDYLVSTGEIDPARIASVGHSRLARTSLWAGANDLRISFATASCGGGLQRSDISGKITTDGTSAHWSMPAIYDYIGRDNELPTDIHMLYALIAPRHLFISIGENDLASDPFGTYDMLQFAKHVWADVFGIEVIPDGNYFDLASGTVITSEGVCVNLHSGGHVFSQEDWNAYIDYMNQYLK